MRSKQALFEEAAVFRGMRKSRFLDAVVAMRHGNIDGEELKYFDAMTPDEQHALAIGMLDLPQPLTMGSLSVGCAATVTGSDAAHDVVVDFTGAVDTQFTAPYDLTPVLITHSAVNGSEFKIRHEGIWQITGLMEAQTAASVRAAIGFDNALGDLSIDPVMTTRTVDMGLRIAAAADTDPIKLTSGPIVVQRLTAKDPLLAIVRMLASNNAGAGAADAAVAVALTYLKITRTGNIPRALAA